MRGSFAIAIAWSIPKRGSHSYCVGIGGIVNLFLGIQRQMGGVAGWPSFTHVI